MRQLFFLLSLLLAVDVCGQPRDTLSLDTLMARQNPAYSSLKRAGTRFLALDNYGLFGFRRYRYFLGQSITFRYRGRKYRDTIYRITDSTFSLLLENPNNFLYDEVTFRLDSVQRIYQKRRIPWLTAGSYLFPIAAAMYFGGEAINSGFNGLSLRNPGTIYPTAGLLGLGALGYFLSNPRYRINRNHRLQVLRTY